MIYLLIKTFITAIVVVGVSEIAKRSSLLAAIIASVPLTTFLALIWLYWDTKNTSKIIELSNSVLLMVIPSLSFFIFLPILIKLNFSFVFSMIASIFLTSICYYLFLFVLEKLGYPVF